MKIIFPNILMLLLRIILLASFIYMFQWPLEKYNSGQYLSNPIGFWFALIIVSMLPLYIFWTLLGVLWVTISKDNDIIRFHYLFKTVDSSPLDIDGYYTTTKNTKISSYKGILIKLKSDRLVDISEYNIKSIHTISDFLQKNKIPLRGVKKS